jgi:hypothetical protein
MSKDGRRINQVVTRDRQKNTKNWQLKVLRTKLHFGISM